MNARVLVLRVAAPVFLLVGGLHLALGLGADALLGARLVSIAVHGVPPPLVLALLGSELLAPPLLLAWLSNCLRTGPTAAAAA